LDLRPDESRYLTIKQAAEYLIKQGIQENIKAVACARIGSKDQKIIYAKLSELKGMDYGKPPYCIIIPAKLHFMEEEFLEKVWNIKY
jgi:diphthine synthase